jgi:S1-C subfamily serine protease
MLVDLLIILIVVYAVARNWGAGFISQFFSALGLIGGLFLGRLVQSFTVSLVHTSSSRAIVTIVTILGVGLIGLSVGEYIGLNFKYRLHFKNFIKADNYLGSVLTGVTMLVIVWLAASVIQSLPATRIKGYVNSSHIIAELNKVMPSAPNIISELGKIIDPNGFPDVFIGEEPIPNTNVTTPSLGSLLNVVNADRDSVVRVQGAGCGGLVTGSGFVVGPGLIVTNAHVVAGINAPYVYDINGKHAATTIWFDPDLDLAVLRTSDLAGKPLSINLATLSSGTPGAVLGYPGGGPFKADPAAVMEEFNASGHNIYGNGVTLRDVYEISANVIPGNSGGPLINKSGQVIGVVFAQSTTYSNVGYALAMGKVNKEVNQAKDRTTPVKTGSCAQ